MIKKIRQQVILSIKGYSLKKLLILIASISCTCLLVAFRDMLILNAEDVLSNHRQYVVYIVPASIVLGLIHAYTGNAEDHTLYPLRFLGPILASPLTCLTYAIVINSCIALIYLICFDKQTLQKYDAIDQTTLTFTLLLLITWSVGGIVKIFLDCIKLKSEQTEGEIIDKDDDIMEGA